jgi:hypothetical protein
MDDFTEITSALKYENSDTHDHLLENDDIDDIVGVDKYETLSNRMVMLQNENIQLRERLDAIEAKIIPMFAEFSKGAPRSRISVRNPDALRNEDTFANIDDGSDASSYAHVETLTPPRESEITRRRSTTPMRRTTSSNGDMGHDMQPRPSSVPNPFLSYGMGSDSNHPMFKSNSATAPQGYTQKANVWGTALASLMVGAIRYYATKRPMIMTRVDEVKVARVYTAICSTLYEAAMCKPLPGVKDPCTLYLSNAISRTSKTDIPISNASDWLLMESCQEGRDVMSVLRVMVKTAKLVPEAMVHPISQLIPYMMDELVTQVERDGNVIVVFAISSQANVSQTPSPWETWCSILRKDAITKHVLYRTMGKTPTETIHKMSSEMKHTELADKQNWNKLTDLGPLLNR